MKLEDCCVYLASGSPRRKEMLFNDGLSPYIVKPGCDEDIHLDLDPRQLVMSLALKKGLAAREIIFSQGIGPAAENGDVPYVIISADTVVCKDGEVFGKPESREDAKRMLLALKGDVHQVCSGVYLSGSCGGKSFSRLMCDVTDVFVRDFDPGWLENYLDTDEPYDKAGAYAIQGAFGVSIDHIEGDYDNVVGLPYEMLKRVLSEIDPEN